jgi:hypothetical protein
MGWTNDCVQTISREHFISAAVLKAVGSPNVALSGVPWIARGETRILPTSNLTGNILCKRHNEAFSKLDTTAGEIFAGLKRTLDDILNKKTLSRRWLWLLFSGEELELWLLKTAIGLFHSGNVAKSGVKLNTTQDLNPTCYRILYDGLLPAPCGVYVEPIQLSAQLNQFQLQPLSDDAGQRMIGLRLSYLNFALLLLFDPDAVYGLAATGGKTYRPTYLTLQNARRTHTIVLTWTTVKERGVVQVGY